MTTKAINTEIAAAAAAIPALITITTNSRSELNVP